MESISIYSDVACKVVSVTKINAQGVIVYSMLHFKGVLDK